MRPLIAYCLAGGLVAFSGPAFAQTSLSGSALVLKSRGGTSTTLSSTGYLGTYLTVPAGGATVNFNVNASAPGAAGHMNLVIADSKFGFNVSGAATNYATGNVSLAAGTYLVRAERDYANGSNQSFAVNNLSVNTISGGAAQFSNVGSATNAMSAANTYINNYRKGTLNLGVQGIAPGTAVQVRLRNSAFKFGTAVPDPLSTYLTANPAAGSTAAKYQERLLKNFNSITPENGGKWAGSDTSTQLRQTDRMLSFADANDLRVRQHGLIWGTQQPTRINNLFTSARSTDPAISGPAKASIQSAIDGRLGSYVGGINTETGGTTGKPAIVRTKQYADLDVYNESYHTGSAVAATTNANYWRVLGATESAGAAVTAGIYNRTRAAVVAAGANTRLFTNEYNVLNWGPDPYGQWYSQHVESIRKAGGNVGGVGVQFYADPGVSVGGGSVDPNRVYTTLANLSTQGLPLELTEFGTKVGTDVAGALTTSMRLAFGTPEMTGFTLWGFYNYSDQMWEGARGSVLYDRDFNITPAGSAYEALRAQWTTDVTTTIAADGSIALPNGAFYGDYEVIIRGQRYGFEFDRTNNRLMLVVLKGDVNNDEVLSSADLDAIFAATNGPVPTAQMRYDLNGDGRVITAANATASDTDYLLRAILGTEYGDADLDGQVNFADLVKLAQNYNQLTGMDWADGNFNGDGAVNFQDLVALAQNYNFNSGTGAGFAADWALAQSMVPEPASLMTAGAMLAGMTCRRRAR